MKKNKNYIFSLMFFLSLLFLILPLNLNVVNNKSSNQKLYSINLYPELPDIDNSLVMSGASYLNDYYDENIRNLSVDTSVTSGDWSNYEISNVFLFNESENYNVNIWKYRSVDNNFINFKIYENSYEIEKLLNSASILIVAKNTDTNMEYQSIIREDTLDTSAPYVIDFGEFVSSGKLSFVVNENLNMDNGDTTFNLAIDFKEKNKTQSIITSLEYRVFDSNLGYYDSTVSYNELTFDLDTQTNIITSTLNQYTSNTQYQVRINYTVDYNKNNETVNFIVGRRTMLTVDQIEFDINQDSLITGTSANFNLYYNNSIYQYSDMSFYIIDGVNTTEITNFTLNSGTVSVNVNNLNNSSNYSLLMLISSLPNDTISNSNDNNASRIEYLFTTLSFNQFTSADIETVYTGISTIVNISYAPINSDSNKRVEIIDTSTEYNLEN